MATTTAMQQPIMCRSREAFPCVNAGHAGEYRVDWLDSRGIACKSFVMRAMLERATAAIAALGGGQIVVHAVGDGGSLSWVCCIIGNYRRV